MHSIFLKMVIVLGLLCGLAGAANAYVITTSTLSAGDPVGEVDGTSATLTMTISAIPLTGLNSVSAVSLTLDLMKCETGPLVDGGALKLACDTTGSGHPEEISVTLTGPSGQTIDIILDNTITGNETYTNPDQFGKISLIFDDISSTVVGGNFVGGSFAPSVPFVGALLGTVVVGDWILTIADNSQDFPLGYANFSLTITGDDAAAVPEPATTGLVALGLWALAALRRKPVRFRS